MTKENSDDKKAKIIKLFETIFSGTLIALIAIVLAKLQIPLVIILIISGILAVIVYYYWEAIKKWYLQIGKIDPKNRMQIAIVLAIILLATGSFWAVKSLCQGIGLCTGGNTSTNAIVIEANKKCSEYGGTPIQAINITNNQIEKWRSVGGPDNTKTNQVIYCEVHQISGYATFGENDTIPAGAIITSDLGADWESTYSSSLERLVHDGGGWGVFLTLQRITVQHANDLNHNVGGLYWLVWQ